MITHEIIKKNSIVLIIPFFLLFLLCSTDAQFKKHNSLFSQINQDSLKSLDNNLNKADSLFEKSKYKEALSYYQRVASLFPGSAQTPTFLFKMGYCYLAIARSSKAIDNFKLILKRNPDLIIRDYVEYLLANSYLQNNDTLVAYKIYHHVLKISPSPYLKSLVNWQLAKLEKKPKKALEYLNQVKTKYLEDNYQVFVQYKLSLLHKINSKQFIKYLLKVSAKDFHKSFEDSLFSLLQTQLPQLTPSEKLKILDIYRLKEDDVHFNQWYLLIKDDSTFTPKNETKLSFIRALKLYRDKKYQSSFKLFSSLKDQLLASDDRAEKYLHLARCNARLGFIHDAIKAYYIFQKKFPHHKLAPDALWWIALTYEQRKDFEKSKKYLQLLARKYKKEGTEAQFRLIFMDLLAGEYISALKKIKKLKSRLNYDDKFRAAYWERFIYLQTGDLDKANQIEHFLLQDPLQNYYTVKFFLQTRQDSLLQYLQKSEKLFFKGEVRTDFNRKIDRVLMVLNLLGEKFARNEIMNMKNRNYSNIKETIILAELNEKLKNYGIAYSMYRDLYYSHYIKKPIKEKLHLVKRLYPLYYDNLVFETAQKFDVDPLLIYGIMKRESMFQKNVKSYANAFGLLQIIPPTAKRLARLIQLDSYREPLDLFKPEINIPLGVYYISKLQKDFNGHYPSIIAAYNAGEARVKKWRTRYKTMNDELFIELIPLEQTRKYVKYVLYYYYIYQWLYNNNSIIKFRISS